MDPPLRRSRASLLYHGRGGCGACLPQALQARRNLSGTSRAQLARNLDPSTGRDPLRGNLGQQLV
jgi:hypothetical protein